MSFTQIKNVHWEIGPGRLINTNNNKSVMGSNCVVKHFFNFKDTDVQEYCAIIHIKREDGQTRYKVMSPDIEGIFTLDENSWITEIGGSIFASLFLYEQSDISVDEETGNYIVLNEVAPIYVSYIFKLTEVIAGAVAKSPLEDLDPTSLEAYTINILKEARKYNPEETLIPATTNQAAINYIFGEVELNAEEIANLEDRKANRSGDTFTGKVELAPISDPEFSKNSPVLKMTSSKIDQLDRTAVLEKESPFLRPMTGDNPSEIYISPDGINFYAVAYGTNRFVYRFVASTPWDVTTIALHSSYSYAAQDTVGRGLFFSTDGTKMFLIGSSSDRVHEYILSTPWDITTARYSNNSLLVSSYDTTPEGLFFSADGTKLFITGSSSDKVIRFNMSTPWSVASALYHSEFYVGGIETLPTGLHFNTDGTILFVVGSGFPSGADQITVYELENPYEISAATYSYAYRLSYENTPQSLFFRPDGLKMYMLGASADIIRQYNVFLPFELLPDVAYAEVKTSFLLKNAIISGERKLVMTYEEPQLPEQTVFTSYYHETKGMIFDVNYIKTKAIEIGSLRISDYENNTEIYGRNIYLELFSWMFVFEGGSFFISSDGVSADGLAYYTENAYYCGVGEDITFSTNYQTKQTYIRELVKIAPVAEESGEPDFSNTENELENSFIRTTYSVATALYIANVKNGHLKAEIIANTTITLDKEIFIMAWNGTTPQLLYTANINFPVSGLLDININNGQIVGTFVASA